MFLERHLYLSFLLPCSWICCWSVYITFLPLRFSFWLLVGSTSLVPVGPFLLHAVLAVDMLQCDESEIKWEIEWNWSLQIGTFSKRSSPRDNFPPILLDPRLALPIPEATKAKVIWIFEFPIHVGLVDLTYTHWLHGIDWSNDDIYSCRVCLSCYQWSFTCSCCLNKTDSNTQQLTLRLNEKRSTVRPSDHQVLSSEINSALRSELQVLGALQALLNLIRLSRKEHTPLTPRLLTLHWHRRSWIFFWLMCKVLLSAWLQRSIPPTNLSSANWRNVLRTKTISVT